jgi:hypothetical protein
MFPSHRTNQDVIVEQWDMYEQSIPVFPNQGFQEPWGSTEHHQGFHEKELSIYTGLFKKDGAKVKLIYS